MWCQRLAAGGLQGALSARTPAARLSRSCLDTCLRQFPLLNSHTRHSNGSSRGLLTCKASSASEVGPKKPKRPAGKQPQQQPEKHDRHQHQQQQHSSEWLMDMDEDSDDEEDNFLVRCRGTEAITMPTLAFDKLAPYMDAVIKVYCVHTEPNYSLPWQRKRQYTSTSTGFVAAGGERWLLTNAHSVDYHTQVKVKKRGDDQKFLARVLALGVDCDIALLTVDDPAFWEGLVPLEFGPLPQLQDTVAVVGYPIGGDTISVTAGVVSRIETTQYSHGSMDLLGIQIDAAINGGNSGGPVFNKRGQCCGIAFQGLSGSDVENVGYVIPTPVVHHFLTDYVENGKITGFPGLGIQWQRMESEALRQAHHMKPGQKGVLIRRVNQTSAAAQQLQSDDVLLSFDGQPIANDGTVPFRTGERIAFSHLISRKFVGEKARLEVLRGGEQLTLDVTLSKPSDLVPAHLSNRNPSYFLVGGLVFTVACEPYLESEYGDKWSSEAPVRILDALFYGMPSVAGQQVVLLSQVLADESTLGYEDMENVQILAVNGTSVTNLQHLAQLVTSCTDEFLQFTCDYCETVVVRRQQAVEGTQTVLLDHSIPAAMSQDIQQVLNVPWPSLPAENGVQQHEQVGAVAAAAVDGTGG